MSRSTAGRCDVVRDASAGRRPEVVLRLLRARAADGAAVVMTTHDPEAAAAADRVVHLDDGVVVPG